MTSVFSRAWMIVAMLWVVAMLNYLDRLMIATMPVSLKEAIPMTDGQFGLLMSAFLWVYAAVSPMAGFMADRFGRSRVIVVSLLIWSLLTWLTACAQTYGQLLFFRAAMGISEACYIPAAMALIVEYHRGPTRSLAIGIHNTGVMTGAALGGLGGWIAERYGWQRAFEIFGVVGILYACFLAVMLRDPPRSEEGADSAGSTPARMLEAWPSLLRNRDFKLLVVFWSILGMVGWIISTWTPSYLYERFALPQGRAGLLANGFLHFAAFGGSLAGGVLADQWSRRSGERVRVYVAMLGMCLAAPAVYLVGQTGLLPLALTGLVLYGLTRPWADSNLMPILCLVVDPRYRATAFGVLNMFACFTAGLMVYAGGVLKDQGVPLNATLQGAAGLLVVCAVTMLFVRTRVAKETASVVAQPVTETRT